MVRDECVKNRKELKEKFSEVEIFLSKYPVSKSRGYLMDYIKRYGQAIDVYKQCEDSLLAEDWYRLGLCYSLATKEFEEAEKCYNIALEGTDNKNLYHKILYNKALNLVNFLKRDYQVALDDIDKVLKYKPDDFEAWVIKGNILLELEKEKGNIVINDEKAQECYRKSDYILKISNMDVLGKIKYFLTNLFRKEYIEYRVYPLFKDFELYEWGTFDYFKEVYNDCGD